MFVLANTPRSFLSGIQGTSAFQRLRRDVALTELVEAYDRFTAREHRDEIVVALAYASLLAILLNKDRATLQRMPDSSRLDWGEEFEQLSESIRPAPTTILDICAPATPVQRNHIVVASR
jgi:hypothetical protein